MMRPLLLLIALLLCASSHGAFLNFNFTATVTNIDGIAPASFGSISTGDEFGGVFTVDTSAMPHPQSAGGYFGLVPNMAFNPGDQFYSGQSAQGIVDTYADGAINDFIQFSGVFVSGADIVLGSYQFTFADRDANAIGSPHLLDASTHLNMARFFDNSIDAAYGSLFFNELGNSTTVNFRVDLVTPLPVPVPAALWLLLSGIGVIGSSYRSTKKIT